MKDDPPELRRSQVRRWNHFPPSGRARSTRAASPLPACFTLSWLLNPWGTVSSEGDSVSPGKGAPKVICCTSSERGASAVPHPALDEAAPPSSGFTKVGLKPNLVRPGGGWEPLQGYCTRLGELTSWGRGIHRIGANGTPMAWAPMPLHR